jgi:hypothetical protein
MDMAFNTGVQLERERIIKLLEVHINLKEADDVDQTTLDYHEDKCGLCKNFYGLGVALQLIKGETK